MKTIIMDSANKYLVVALYEDEKCLASLQEEGNRKQSEYAIVYLQKLLQENQLKISDFDEMVITIGPGSYTGVRVALTIAKTLNATMNLKIKTVSSLKAMAGMKKAISILDARSKKLFLGIYNEGKVIVEDCLINMGEFENYQKKYSDYEIVGDTSLVGLPEQEINLVKNIDEYTGYKDVTLSDEEMSYFYLHLNENQYDSLLNEYLIIRKNDGEVVDYRKWNGQEYHPISYKQINSHFMGKIKPRNPQQVLAFDMLQDKEETIKVISGRFGSGKDYLMIANAIKLIEEGKFEKLIYVRNAIGVKDANEVGFLPGTKFEKILPFAMPLADHLGGENGLEMQIMAGNIEVEHLGYIRGRDIKNAIIYVSEAENLTKEHVQLLIGRVGEGSALWMNGDFKQTDSTLFRMNNGLLSTVQKLAGHIKFGYVQLQKTERSETAAMADLLD